MQTQELGHADAIVESASDAVPVAFIELRQSIPSRVEAISALVDRLMRLISKFRALDGSELNIEIALREAVTNAVIHGNHKDVRKRVYVMCRCGKDGEVLLIVHDQGRGFDSRSLPDPTTPENRLAVHGRGIYLMRALMDEVRFEQSGAVVKMRKRPNAASRRRIV